MGTRSCFPHAVDLQTAAGTARSTLWGVLRLLLIVVVLMEFDLPVIVNIIVSSKRIDTTSPVFSYPVIVHLRAV